VTVRHHADLLPLRHEGADHPCAEEGLSGSGWALNREYRLVELTDDPEYRGLAD
jgi:hypothetical protein